MYKRQIVAWPFSDAAEARLERHLAINQRVDGVVAAHADVVAGVELGALLADVYKRQGIAI